MKQDKRNFCLSIAGHSFFIHSLYTDTYEMSKEYLCEDEFDREINISISDIEYERSKAEESKKAWSEAYLETLAAYRKISEVVLDYDTFLMHGSVVAYKDAAYMFTAASGTGKTTHIRKWLDNLKDAYVVNGDKPLIRINAQGAIACGTPWCGKEKLGRNCMVPLKAIVLMERGENNEIEEITFEMALPFLLRQTYMPKNANLVKKTLGLLAQLKGKTRFYKFVFNNMKADAFCVAYNGVNDNLYLSHF